MKKGSPSIWLPGQQTIFIISPQPWDGYQVSKHHYAMALAEAGHDVFFIEPPDASMPRGAIRIDQTGVARLQVVRYATWFPYRIKFHLRPVFNLAMRRQARLLQRAIGRKPELVWDFDNAWQFASLKPFGARRNILHLVDYFPPRLGRKDADLVVLLAAQLGEGNWEGRVPLIVGHCLGEEFNELAQRVIASPERARGGTLKAAYMGNLNHLSVDWETFWTLISAHPQVKFMFIGPGPQLDGRTDRQAHFAALVLEAENADFLGLRVRHELVTLAAEVDIWLYAIDWELDANKGADSHKILEYLATGSVCVSTRLEAYLNSPLVIMTKETHNREFSHVFKSVLANLENLNSAEQRRARAAYVIDRSYPAAIETIMRNLEFFSTENASQMQVEKRALHSGLKGEVELNGERL